MDAFTSLLRFLVLGRRDGFRARLRRKLGLSRRPAPHEPAAQSPPPPAPAGPLPTVSAPAGFLPALRAEALGPGEVTEVIVEGTAVALCNVDGEFFAVSNVCPHAGGPIGDGTLEAHTVTCPYHGWSFDVRDGRCFVNAEVNLPRYEVKVVQGVVCIRP